MNYITARPLAKSRISRVSLSFAALGLAAITPAFATSISLGNASILADSPTNGEQELTINNLTGPGLCSAGYAACSSLNFTAWTLTVAYTNSSGANSVSYTDAVYGDITPSSTNNVFDFDLCGGVNVNNSCTPATTITSVEFAGQISPSSFCLYAAGSGGCPTSNQTTFFASPSFDMVWNASSSTGTPYVDENNSYAFSPDITVSDAIAPAPEPGSFFLLTAPLPFVWLVRRSKKAA